MSNRTLAIACLTLVILALGSMVIASSLGEVSGEEAHTMPDGRTMRGEQRG